MERMNEWRLDRRRRCAVMNVASWGCVLRLASMSGFDVRIADYKSMS